MHMQYYNYVIGVCIYMYIYIHTNKYKYIYTYMYIDMYIYLAHGNHNIIIHDSFDFRFIVRIFTHMYMKWDNTYVQLGLQTMGVSNTPKQYPVCQCKEEDKTT